MVFNSNLFIMKTVYTKLLFLSIFLCSISSFSQANMEFNQVLNIGANLGGNEQGPTIIVPSGKIWKVTSYSQFNGLYINGHRIMDVYIDYGTQSIANNNGILWLNEGDSFYFTTLTSGNNDARPWYMSILEFNK